MSFTVIPAIDLRAGRVVRLKQGDYAQQTTYDFDPRALARDYAEAGADWLHLVDLDGARGGSLENLAVIEAIARDGMRIQAGGGVRSEADVQRLLGAGVSRVVLGSLAIREPETVEGWLASRGADRFTLALDTLYRDGAWTLPSAGWTKRSRARWMISLPGTRRMALHTCYAPTLIATACWPASIWISTGISRQRCRPWRCRLQAACARWTIFARRARPGREG